MEKRVLSYCFDDVTVDLPKFRVLKAGEPTKIEPKAYEVLLHLVENRDRVVEKAELLEALWSDSFVTENALTRVVAQLRRELGDAKKPRYIATAHKRGYRFVPDVTVTYDGPAPAAWRPHAPGGALGSHRAGAAAAALVYYARRYDEALADFRRAVGPNADFAPALHGLGAGYELTGMLREAVDALERAKAAGGG